LSASNLFRAVRQLSGVVRKLSRRAALGVLGTGLAAVTGVSTRQSDCGGFASVGRDCDGPLSLTGPDQVSRSAGNPRFVVRNAADSSALRLAPGAWSVYRVGEEWTHVASGDAGSPVTLDGDSTVAYLLLVDGDGAGPGLTAMETTTRYVGPVSLSPGEYAFVLSGRHDGQQVSVADRFEVTAGSA
jgi:hypothetical protein